MGGSIYGCTFFMGPIAAAVTNRIGMRYTAWLGAVISILSLVFCYFVNNNYWLFTIFYGFVTGVGFGFMNLIAYTSRS